MTAPLFIVEWDPTTDTAHVRATFDTVTAEETVAGLDQFAACVRKLAEIDNLTGVSGREYVSVAHPPHDPTPAEAPFAGTPTCSCGHTRSQHGRDHCNLCECPVGHE